MTTETQTESINFSKQASSSNFKRLARFFGIRLVLQLITIVIGVYITIIIANMGGYVDNILRSEITERVNQEMAAMAARTQMSSEMRQKLAADTIALEVEAAGLNEPFAIRSVRHLGNALTLNLGRARFMTSDHGSKMVKNIILERLPATLLLMGTSQILLFVVSLFLALSLSRHYGSIWDRIVVALSPSSSIPAWFYGIFLILIFAASFKWLPFSGMLSAPPPTNPVDYALDIIKHLILPASALFISGFFINVYAWRTFFLIYSSEDYVDMAKAKGLPDRDIERRYILRPTLPNIITHFALLLIGMWTGAVLTETVFLWPGLGRTIYQAVSIYDTAVIVGTTIIMAYLLALTVFFLDFIYAIIDPRVKIGGGNA